MADEKNVSKTETDKKSAKSEKSKKPGIFRRIGKYLRDTKGELKKIIWPTFPTVLRNTFVTLTVCVVLGVLVCAVDFGLGSLIDLVLSLKG